ncbi:DUF3019 domain-containing protein [Agaribacter flavus]|uniref:DUF3019 domain-containing protein n=1 Tax=Agaribacter flavus TaxID=1902781 RepID=A0ABV7FNY8_9ALTE
MAFAEGSDSISSASPIEVGPDVCVTMNSSEICEMDLQMQYQLENSNINTLCFALKEVSLGCWPLTKLPTSLPIQLSRNTWFQATSTNGDVIFEKQLLVKYTQPIKQRRRINNPWSIF